MSSSGYRGGDYDGMRVVQSRILILKDKESPVYMFTIYSLVKLADKYMPIFNYLLESLEFVVEEGSGSDGSERRLID